MPVNNPIGMNALEGSLGVLKITFNNISMGKSMGGCEIEKVEDIKDIMHDQNGTQPWDKIVTGQAWLVRTPLSEITVARIQQVSRGIVVAAGGSTKFEDDMFRSGRDNFAKKLILKRINSDGSETTDPMYTFNFYLAFPRITAPFTYTVDGQRVMEVEWYIFKSTTNNCYGYMGYNSSLGIAA